MKDGLKIYACSGLCNQIGTAPQDFQYWRDDTVTTNNTRAVNTLFAEINYLEAQLQYQRGLTDAEVIDALNRIDLLVVCLMFAQDHKQDELPLAGQVVAGMLQEGMFDNQSLDDTERDNNLFMLCQTAEQRFMAGEGNNISNNFTTWFDNNITSQSYVGLSDVQRQRCDEFYRKQSGVGATGSQDAGQYLFDTGEYYLYQYMTRAEAYRQSYIVGKKWDKQREMYNYVHKCYDPIYATPESVDNIIYTGICKQMNCTPEYAVEQLTGNKSKGIGEPISAAVITAIATLISAIISALSLFLSFIGQVLAVKYQAPTEAASGTPEDYEWTEPTTTQSGISKWALLAAGIALLVTAFTTTYKKPKKS